MRKVLPREPLPYLLLAVIAALGGTLAATLWRGTHVAALLQTRARQMTIAGLASTAPDPAGAPDIKDRALFYASRKFFVETAPPVTAQLLPPAYVLEGTLIIPGRPAAAFLKHQADGAPRTVHPGEALEGWKVGDVGPGSVILADGPHRIEITTKGIASIASLPPAQRPVTRASPVRERTVMLGSREPQKPRPIWTGNDDALPKPAVRVYRPPN